MVPTLHYRPVNGLGIRLYPCGIASGYFAVIHPGLRDRPCRPSPQFPARHEERARTAPQPESTGLELVISQEA